MISSSYLVICARQRNLIKRNNVCRETEKLKDRLGGNDWEAESWMNCSTPFECKTISRNTDVIQNNSNNRSYCGRRNFCQTETINLHRQWFRIVILWTLIQLHRRSKQKLYPIIQQWRNRCWRIRIVLCMAR